MTSCDLLAMILVVQDVVGFHCWDALVSHQSEEGTGRKNAKAVYRTQ